MSSKPLPESAYAALEGLKSQASSAIEIASGKPSGKASLATAHGQIAANEVWAKRIIKALFAGKGRITIDNADNAWLERTFADSKS